ncbi:MAG: sugar-binding transcriptional regulator [Alphaproteobacteria bacterium]
MARAPTAPLIDEDERFLTRVAWACEIEGVTQAAAAARFGVTRLRVNRALGEARRRGIVRVVINSIYGPCAEAEQALKAKYSLDDVYVAPSPADDQGVQTVVATALGYTLAELLEDPKIKLFGMSWGNTLNLATRFMKPLHRPDLEIVSVMGGVTRGSDLNSFEITKRLAELCNARHSYFTAPLYAGSQESRDILRRQDVFREVIEKICNADAIAMAAGDMTKRSLLVRDGLTSDRELTELIDAGGVGDILGYFLAADGSVIDHPLNRRIVGIELDDLRRMPNVILAAGGTHKIPIMKAVLGLGLINSLVTDEATAITLLE